MGNRLAFSHAKSGPLIFLLGVCGSCGWGGKQEKVDQTATKDRLRARITCSFT